MAIIMTKSTNGTIDFWPGWKSAHEASSTVLKITTDEWKSEGVWHTVTVKFAQCIYPLFSVAFFLLFGITEQRRCWYRALLLKVARPFWLKRKPDADPVSDVVFDDFRHADNLDIETTQATITWVPCYSLAMQRRLLTASRRTNKSLMSITGQNQSFDAATETKALIVYCSV